MSKDDHKERQRVTKACDNCRKKKIKCDAKDDMCTSCELLQVPCLYLDPTKKRGPPKGAGRYINAIEDRLHRMEAIVGGLVPEDDPSSEMEAGASAGSSTGAFSSASSKKNPSSTSTEGALSTKPKRRKSAKKSLPEDEDPHQQQAGFSQEYNQDPLLLQQQHMHQFQVENPFQPQQQLDLNQSETDQPLQQQQQQQHQHLPQSDMATLHRHPLVDSTFASFNSPSPTFGSEPSKTESSPGIEILPRLGVDTPPFSGLDDLEEDMGHLTLDHKGIERYVGKSSPMFYNRRHWGGYSIREREQPETRKFVENPDLPSAKVMTHLLNLHFTYVHPFAPVFIWSKFLKRLKERNYTPSFLFLLNSIFALASRFSDDLSLRKDPTKPETVGWQFAEKAKAILDTLYDAPDLHCVGALVLLSFQQMGTGGGYRAWMYIGLSIRMAQHLGLNRDCAKLNPHMPALDREERNRVWWSCFMADRVVSASFGRPQGINEHDVDATYPEGIDEEDIQLEYRLDDATVMLTGPSPDSEKNFVHMASLMRIMGKVMVSLYSPLSKASSLSSSSMTDSAPLEQLDKDLTDWLLTLPPHLQFRSVQQEPGTFVCTLHLTFYVTLILLHRPYSHQSAHYGAGDSSISLSICTSAANNIVEMGSSLMRATDDNRAVPRIKCLLHNAVYIFFTAGIVHITNCTSSDPVLAASAKLRTVETLRCLSMIEDVWISAKWCGNNIKSLVQTREIDLPLSPEGVKYAPLMGSLAANLTTPTTPSTPTTSTTPQIDNLSNPTQVDMSPTPALFQKEQSFAFDVDQIMGYYQGTGSRHAEPLGRNSRHFSPTPYFSPVSPHHAAHQNQNRSHPGLTQGHSPLPRRPRQAKNTSPSPTGSISSNVTPSSSASASVSGSVSSAVMFSAAAPESGVLGVDSQFYHPATTLIDPFATPGSATAAPGLPPPPSENDVSLQMYQNPFSSTLWNLPTSLDSEEWMMYTQNGGALGHSSGTTATPVGLSQQQQQHSGTRVKLEGGMFKPMVDMGSLEIHTLNSHGSSSIATNGSNGANPVSEHTIHHLAIATNSSPMGGRVHPLAQSLTRNELLGQEEEVFCSKVEDGGEGGIVHSYQHSHPLPHQHQYDHPSLGSRHGSTDNLALNTSSLMSHGLVQSYTPHQHNPHQQQQHQHHHHHPHSQPHHHQQPVLTSQHTPDYKVFMDGPRSLAGGISSATNVFHPHPHSQAHSQQPSSHHHPQQQQQQPHPPTPPAPIQAPPILASHDWQSG